MTFWGQLKHILFIYNTTGILVDIFLPFYLYLPSTNSAAFTRWAFYFILIPAFRNADKTYESMAAGKIMTVATFEM